MSVSTEHRAVHDQTEQAIRDLYDTASEYPVRLRDSVKYPIGHGQAIYDVDQTDDGVSGVSVMITEIDTTRTDGTGDAALLRGRDIIQPSANPLVAGMSFIKTGAGERGEGHSESHTGSRVDTPVGFYSVETHTYLDGRASVAVARVIRGGYGEDQKPIEFKNPQHIVRAGKLVTRLAKRYIEKSIV